MILQRIWRSLFSIKKVNNNFHRPDVTSFYHLIVDFTKTLKHVYLYIYQKPYTNFNGSNFKNGVFSIQAFAPRFTPLTPVNTHCSECPSAARAQHIARCAAHIPSPPAPWWRAAGCSLYACSRAAVAAPGACPSAARAQLRLPAVRPAAPCRRRAASRRPGELPQLRTADPAPLLDAACRLWRV